MSLFKAFKTEIKEEDLRIMNEESNRHIVRLLSISLILGGVLNFISQYMFFHLDFIEVLLLSLVLLLMGLFTRFILGLNLRDQIKTHLVLINVFILIPVSVFQFIEYASITIWALPFIFIIISILFINQTLLLYITVSTFITQFIVWVLKPQVTVVVDASDYVIRVGLLGIAIFLAFYINKQYIARMKENAHQVSKIQRMAFSDSLTGLPNRLFFADALNRGISGAKRLKKTLGVMFLDLDHFKIVNDTIGHEQGDVLLKLVASRLRDLMRQEDVVARIGGDEFMILVQDVPDMAAIENISKKIVNSFRQPFHLQNQDFHVTASLGIALFPTDGETAEQLIKNADMAMYKAKEQGKNQFSFCSFQMKNQNSEIIKMTNALFRALERGEFELYYQPQVLNPSGKVIGLEALIRWHHPELGLVLPKAFISLAEQTGLINEIGEWVLRQACRQNKLWQLAGLPCVRMGVNVSLNQFDNPNIVDVVDRILEETGLAGDYLELEITESMAMKETKYMAEILNAIKKLGVTIAIDDFGTVYSSLNYLKHLPVDRIKISLPFIQGIAVNEKDEAIATAIIVLARKLGLHIIAEGVETKEQLVFLKQKMCDEIQGFYYYHPMPADQVEEVLRKGMAGSNFKER